MKKILPIALVLVLVLALMIVPAFADDSISGVLVDGRMNLPYLPAPGRYLVSADFAFFDGQVISISEVVDFTLVNDVCLAASLSFESASGIFDGTIIIAPLSILDADYDGDAIVAVFGVLDGYVEFTSFALSPAPDQPIPVEDHVGSIGIFFENAVSWVGDILTELISQPLMLIIWVCIAVCGFSFWGIKKMKES